MEIDSNLSHIKDKKIYISLCKNNKCHDCGNKYHYSQMEFDHVPERGNKNFEINYTSTSGFSIENINEELKKCDLVCSNCHKLRTYKRSIIHVKENKNLTNDELYNLTNEDIVKYFKNRAKIKRENSKDKTKEYNKKYRERKENEKNK